MDDLSLLTIISKRQQGQHYEHLFTQQLNKQYDEGKNLPWSLHAQIFGVQSYEENVSHNVPYTQIDNNKSRDLFYPLCTGNICEYQISHSNVNEHDSSGLAHAQNLKTSDIFSSAIALLNEDKIGHTRACQAKSSLKSAPYQTLKRERKCKKQRNFSLIQPLCDNKSNQCSLQPHRVLHKVNSHFDVIEHTSGNKTCHQNYSNLNNKNCVCFEHDKNDLLPAPLQPIKTDIKNNVGGTKLSQAIIESFGTGQTDCNNNCNLVNEEIGVQAKVAPLNPNFSTNHEVNMLFISNLYRQIHNLKLGRVTKKAIQLHVRRNYLKSYKKIQNSGPNHVTPNSLVMSIHIDYSNLNTNSFYNSSEYTFNFEQQSRMTNCSYRQVGQHFTQSIYAFDIHNILKWHSGMLKLNQNGVLQTDLKR